MTTSMATDTMNSSLNCNMFQFNKKLSIYIPIVEESIDDTAIKAIFEHLGLGIISRVDFVYSSLGKKQAFLHFEGWYDCDQSRKVQRDIMDPTCNARLVYDNPKFWPLLPNRNPIENPKLAGPNIIDVLQTKIDILESKLNSIGISPPDYESLGKRARSSPNLPVTNMVLSAPSALEMSASFNHSLPPAIRRMTQADSCGAITGAYAPSSSS